MAANLIKSSKSKTPGSDVNLDHVVDISTLDIPQGPQGQAAEYQIIFTMEKETPAPSTLTWAYALKSDRDADKAGMDALSSVVS